MALKKEITLDNGIIVNYHRIVSLNKITNQANIIEVASYTNEEKRAEEQAYYSNEETNKEMNVFINTIYFSKKYDENETIENAYDYLKTTEEFKDAENA